MRKLSLFVLFMMFIASEAIAADSMIFWYPGEAGTTEDAQPILDAFCDEYLNARLGSAKLSCTYINTVDSGLSFIKGKGPKVGIVSYSAWIQNKDKLSGAKVVLATLPKPGGKETERYELVGLASKVGSGAKVLSSEPMGIQYIREHLFSDLSADVKIETTDQMLFNLKKISEGSLEAFAILTPMEAATVKRLSAPWAKKLVVASQSKPVPSARVVLFDPSWSGAADFKSALLSSNKDQDAKGILGELRLDGFVEGR